MQAIKTSVPKMDNRFLYAVKDEHGSTMYQIWLTEQAAKNYKA